MAQITYLGTDDFSVRNCNGTLPAKPCHFRQSLSLSRTNNPHLSSTLPVNDFLGRILSIPLPCLTSKFNHSNCRGRWDHSGYNWSYSRYLISAILDKILLLLWAFALLMWKAKSSLSYTSILKCWVVSGRWVWGEIRYIVIQLFRRMLAESEGCSALVCNSRIK